jgi:hypothetical protein
MKRTTAAIAIAGLAFTLTACAAQSGAKSDGSATGTNRPTTTVTTKPVETTAAPVNPKLGKAYTWKDGLAVTISAPAAFIPSNTSMVDPAAAYVTFTVTVVNGTAANFDPSMFSTSFQSTNVEGKEVYDSAKNIGGAPSTTLLPGREVQFTIGYGVADPADIVLEVTPDFAHDAAIFTS